MNGRNPPETNSAKAKESPRDNLPINQQAPEKSDQTRTRGNDDSPHGTQTGYDQQPMDIGEHNGSHSTNGRRDKDAAETMTVGQNAHQNGQRRLGGEDSDSKNIRDLKIPKQDNSHKSQSVGGDWETFYPDHPGHPGDQQQAMKQMQRAAEASKQMLYGVYGNVVSILEEYEARTQKTKAARSKIALPDQSRKTVDDVQSIVQTQLLLFETQQRACPKEVSQSINKELRKKTLHWAAVRDEHKMPRSDTDKYICQLYEVLAKGKTKHEILDKPMEPVSAETIKENVQHIFKGKHDAMEIDQQFKHDDKKKATSPETRRSELDDAYRIGAHRMTQEMPELVEILTEDIEEFSADIDDAK